MFPVNIMSIVPAVPQLKGPPGNSTPDASSSDAAEAEGSATIWNRVKKFASDHSASLTAAKNTALFATAAVLIVGFGDMVAI